MYIFLLIIHVLISVVLIMVILAQSSKGGALDGLVGGTASSMFGSHGAGAFLSKWTKIIGAVWMISSLLLAMNIRAVSKPARARALDRIRAESPATVPSTNQEVIDFEGATTDVEATVIPEEATSQPEAVPSE